MKERSSNGTEKAKKKQEAKYLEFGKRLKQCRKNQPEKTTQLALYTMLFGVDDATDPKSKIDKISCWERGIFLPTIENLEKLATTFNVSIDYLLGRIENKNVDTERICELTGLSPMTVDSLIFDQNKLRRAETSIQEGNDIEYFARYGFTLYDHSHKSERTALIDALYKDTELLTSLIEYLKIIALDTVILNEEILTDDTGYPVAPEDINIGSKAVGYMPIDKKLFSVSKLLDLKKALDQFDSKSLSEEKFLTTMEEIPEPLLEKSGDKHKKC